MAPIGKDTFTEARDITFTNLYPMPHLKRGVNDTVGHIRIYRVCTNMKLKFSIINYKRKYVAFLGFEEAMPLLLRKHGASSSGSDGKGR